MEKLTFFLILESICQSRLNKSIIRNDPILLPNHKIFLSHFVAQKDFTEELCRDLEKCYHFPFFDRRKFSLPKGEKFLELILKATQKCQMAVMVVLEEYFKVAHDWAEWSSS